MFNLKQVNSTSINNYLLAYRLIKLGLRPPIVRYLTDLSWRATTDLWLAIHGRPKAGGKLPESVFRYMINFVAAANISSFAAMHIKFFPNQTRLGAEELLISYTEFISIDPSFDINVAYRVVMDLCVGIVALRKCPNCMASYVSSKEHYITKKCPFCRTW
jgi:hypothetical protein